MKALFDNATIKIFFSNNAVSRNLYDVQEIEHVGNLVSFKTQDGKTFLVNFDNVNSIEEL